MCVCEYVDDDIFESRVCATEMVASGRILPDCAGASDVGDATFAHVNGVNILELILLAILATHLISILSMFM